MEDQLHILSIEQGRKFLSLEPEILNKVYSVLKSNPNHPFPANEKHFKYADLKDLPEEKIKVLTSYDAIDGYQTGCFTFKDLKDLPKERITLLTSYNAIDGYQKGCFTFNDLKDLPEEKIKALTSKDALHSYRDGRHSFNELKNLDTKEIEKLTSGNQDNLIRFKNACLDKISNVLGKGSNTFGFSSAIFSQQGSEVEDNSKKLLPLISSLWKGGGSITK